jgi:hypothetical protein
MSAWEPHQKQARTVSPPVGPGGTKTVRFDMDQNTTVQVPCIGVHSDTSSTCTSSTNTSTSTPNSEHLWLSVQELHEIRHREATVLHRDCLRNDIYLDQITILLGMACNAPSVDKLPRGTAVTALTIVCNSPARGLEKETMSCVRQRRKAVIQTFLKSQLAVKALAVDARDREAALCQHYRQLALPACRLARWIAQGDALVVTAES